VDAKRFSFRNAVFSSYLEFHTLDNVQKPIDSECYHLRRNPLEYTRVCCVCFLLHIFSFKNVENIESIETLVFPSEKLFVLSVLCFRKLKILHCHQELFLIISLAQQFPVEISTGFVIAFR
jgi:hypothetical protein